MFASRFTQVLTISAVLALAACASPPDRINNVCAVFQQKDGWTNNWQRSASRAERKYGIPVPVLMATVRKESGFKANARPRRKKILGFIPGKRISSAYGFSQALDGTWDQYRKESGNYGAKRNSFDDAIDFVGWYHSKTVNAYGVSPTDTYNLYLAYYSGWSGFGRGSYRSNTGIQNYARETDDMARRYAAQLQGCR